MCKGVKYLKNSDSFYPKKNNVYNGDNVWFGHFNVTDCYENTIKTFRRRFDRLYEALKKKKILFVYTSGGDIFNELDNRSHDNYNSLCKLAKFIETTYKNTNFKIAAIHINKKHSDTKFINNYTVNVPENIYP